MNMVYDIDLVFHMQIVLCEMLWHANFEMHSFFLWHDTACHVAFVSKKLASGITFLVYMVEM